FARARAAWGARTERETLLPVNPVDFVDDAVDIVIELGALLFDLVVKCDQLLDRVADFHQWMGPKAAALEPVDHSGLGVFRHPAHLSPGIGEKSQRTRS